MWKYFTCSEAELNCKIVLACGQSFRWKTNPDTPDIWTNVLHNRVWYLKQEDGNIYYKTVVDKKCRNNIPYILKCGKILQQMDEELFLRDYFQLDVNIPELYQKWSSVDENFCQLKKNFCGIRMLRQDPVENLFSFICSQNNNISRISQLVEKLCQHYGNAVAECDGVAYYSFPRMNMLAQDSVEENLRALGFGYRAKFIYQSAKYIEDNHGGEKWLHSLREMSYEDAHQQLLSLPGVGAKVADCVCLMSLDKSEAIPIDTHMWQIAVRDYLPHLQKNKTVTDKSYKEIGDFFRGMYGEYAGWGHSVLFSADLKKFEELKDVSNSKPNGKRKTIKVKRKNITGGKDNKKKKKLK